MCRGGIVSLSKLRPISGSLSGRSLLVLFVACFAVGLEAALEETCVNVAGSCLQAGVLSYTLFATEVQSAGVGLELAHILLRAEVFFVMACLGGSELAFSCCGVVAHL